MEAKQSSSDTKKKIRDKDPFGFNKAINWDKLEDPKVLKELEKVSEEEEKDEENKIQSQ